MSGLLRDRSVFPKVVAGFAAAFGIGLGLCGLSFALPSSDPEFHSNWLSMPSLLLMVVSFLGLIAALIAWMVAGITDGGPSRPLSLFDHDDENRDQR